MRARWFLVSFLVVTAAASWAASAGQSIFMLASQANWAGKRGFYLQFENSAEGDEVSRLETLRLYLGAADGTKWAYLPVRSGLETGREYELQAFIGSGSAELQVNGVTAATAEAGFVPWSGPLIVNRIPHWANRPTDYVIRQTSLVLTTSGGRNLKLSFADALARALPLFLFDPQAPAWIEWRPEPGESFAVTVRFRIEPYPELQALAPFIDRYGQSVHAEWPGKVRRDGELREDIAREDAILAGMPPSGDYDEYGGYLRSGWREEGTGYFRAVRRNGYWWLISPLGNPCFYTGVCVFPALVWPTTPVGGREFLFEWFPSKEGAWAAGWLDRAYGGVDGSQYVCFYTANLIRKYGPEAWERLAEERGIRRIRAWGFGGGGKWGAPASVVSTPVLSHGATPKLGRHPDVFDPEVCAVFRRELEQQIAPRRSDPRVLGWSLGNEFGEIITRDEIREILRRPAGIPAKRALLDYAVDEIHGGSVEALARSWDLEARDREALYELMPEPPAADLERLRLFYAGRYYEFVYRTVKSIDPDHLYLGFWITPGWWESPEDWDLIARWCDVIGYDLYTRRFADEEFARRLEATGKPVLCGEFSFPGHYKGTRGFGWFETGVEDDAAAGEAYRQWLRDAARNRFCVGALYFEYRDQPLTGRGPGSGPRLVHDEHFAFGFVDGTDRPKWEMVTRVREANLSAARWRLETME